MIARSGIRRPALLLIAFITALAGCQSASPAPTSQPRRVGTNPLGGVPMEHRLVFFDDAQEFRRGTIDRGVIDDDVVRIALDPSVKRFPQRATWTSPTIEADRPFTELLPSWNVLDPTSTGASFEVRVQDADTGAWSPWLYIGRWGQTVMRASRKVTEFAGGKVAIDTLTLDRPADAFEIRATLYSFDPQMKVSPTLRRVAVCYSTPLKPGEQPTPATMPVSPLPTLLTAAPSTQPDWVRDLPVPFRAQGWEPTSIQSEVCSPTSTNMVVTFAGADPALHDTVMSIYDDEYDLFGNWNRAVAYAGSLGLDAWLARFNSIDDLRRLIAQGQPAVVAIRFGKGEFPSNLMDSSNGHLIVVRGFTPDGDAIVNDPGKKDGGQGVIYKAQELENAWVHNSGGVTYIVHPAATSGGSPSTQATLDCCDTPEPATRPRG